MVALALAAVASAQDLCKTTADVDINPHTPGLGNVPGVNIGQCCEACSSAYWWAKGCRFYTLSKGECWLKANNATVVPSPGKVSGQATAAAPPPPPPPPPPPRGNSGPWIKVGPWGIGDDVNASGEAGTLADAVSPAGNPNVIYTGGQNNGASSGVLKSTDMGKHWVVASNGIFDTRIKSLGVVDDAGDHVFVGVPGAIYETTDGAASWHLVNASTYFGTCYTFKNGSIGGKPYIFASCDVGIANVPVGGGEWSVIPPGGWGHAGYLTVSDSRGANAVLGGCLGGHVFVGDVINTTAANWTSFPDRPCTMLALNPNDANHFIYTKPPLTYQSMDGGQTYESLNHSNIFHCGIDRKGNLYTAAMGGAFVSRDCGPGPNMKRPCSWQAYFDDRVQRRTNNSMVRVAHDYQRISLDFGGTVSFSSDQGLFIVPPTGTALELIKANGNLSNNIALKAAISEGDGPGKNYIVTSVWDWAPLASWDEGGHWPSWQTPADGPSGSCIGEGGGAYGMGRSNHMLLMHHHNILASSYGGKNLTRFVVPHGATVFGPTYSMKAGSRTEPDGAVYAPLFMGGMPWDQLDGKVLACDSTDLGKMTNYTCLATVDIGTTYGWYPKVDYAVWRGDQDGHCHVCTVAGNSSFWNYTAAPGAFSYVKLAAADAETERMLARFDADGDGRIDEADMHASMLPRDKPGNDDADDDGRDCDNDEECIDRDGGDDDDDDRGILVGSTLTMASDHARGRATGNNGWIIKNFNYGSGMNWTWTPLPAHLAGTQAFVTDPTNSTTLYSIAANCLGRSYDQGDTWEPCWEADGLEGPYGGLVIKNSTCMLAIRNGAVPLRTFDAGATWHPLTSAAPVAAMSHGALYSWSGETLILLGSGGPQSAWHPHAGYIWKSADDGNTWTDESADLVTMAVGAAQWYENRFYINTMGQGILYKELE